MAQFWKCFIGVAIAVVIKVVAGFCGWYACIAIGESIFKAFPDARATAVDITARALGNACIFNGPGGAFAFTRFCKADASVSFDGAAVGAFGAVGMFGAVGGAKRALAVFRCEAYALGIGHEGIDTI